MDVVSNRKAWVIALIFVAMFGGCVATVEFGVFESSVDEPVGTLRFDELSVALATDPDREVERIVGHVWRFEGPKSTFSGDGHINFFAVDPGTNDGFDNRLYLSFATRWDKSRFETEEVTIACLITSSSVFLVEPTSPGNDERSIAAKSCRVVEPGTNTASDSS